MAKRKLIKRHKDGIYYAQPYLGTNKVTKKPIRPYKRFPQARTEAEAEMMAQEWLSQQIEAAKLGVSARLVELLSSYIDLKEANDAPANTIKTYRSTLRCYIEPNVGGTLVDEFTSSTAYSLYNVVLMQESRRGGTLDATTIAKIHWFLSGAYKHFCSLGLCSVNPMLSVAHPETSTKEALAYDEEQFAKLSNYLAEALHSTDTSKEAIFARMVAAAAYIALWHGTRAGETNALATSDAQLWRTNMHVHCTMVEKPGIIRRQEKPKGKKSRNLHIYEDPVGMLRDHMAWAEEAVPKAADVLRMLVTMPDGSYMRPSDLSRAYNDLIRDRIGLPKETHFHTLRHTHATWMILMGADIKTVCERIGHAKESTTLELYGHLMPGRDQAAVEAFAEFAKRITKGGEL